MSDMDLNGFFQFMSTNYGWLFLSTVAILVGSYLTLFDRVEKYVKRPKLTFEVKRFADLVKKENDVEYQKETYWIYVNNSGKDIAKQCRAKMKIADAISKKDIESEMVIPYKSGIFPISWRDGYGERDVVDIYPVKNDSGMLKIPLNVFSPAKDNRSAEIIIEWEEPIRKPDPTIPIRLMSRITFFHFTITVYINAENAHTLTKEFDLLMLTSSISDSRRVSFTVKEST